MEKTNLLNNKPKVINFYLDAFVKIIATITFFLLIFGPLVTEIILMALFDLSNGKIVIAVCSSILNFMALKGGYQLGKHMATNNFMRNANRFTQTHKLRKMFWSCKVYKPSSLLSGGYIIYSSPGWYFINLMCMMINSININNIRGLVPIYNIFLAISPVVLYSISVCVSYFIQKTKIKIKNMEGNYNPLPEYDSSSDSDSDLRIDDA